VRAARDLGGVITEAEAVAFLAQCAVSLAYASLPHPHNNPALGTRVPGVHTTTARWDDRSTSVAHHSAPWGKPGRGSWLVDHVGCGGIQAFPVRASRMAARGWWPWLRAVVR